MKTMRVLQIFERLIQKQTINKKMLSAEFQVSEKSIQRDIEDLRTYLSEYYPHQHVKSIIYNHKNNGYQLIYDDQQSLNSSEIVALAKVMLESRAFPEKELMNVLDKLELMVSSQDRKKVQELIKNERFHYLPVGHQQPLIAKIWDLSIAARERRVTKITYLRVDEDLPVTLSIYPLCIMFSEYYFYCIAYIEGVTRDFPATFRVDRIQQYEKLDRRYHMTEKNRFQEGLFRRQVQFMQTGNLLKIKFRFWNKSLESILDRLPNAVVTKDEQSAIIEAEVFGKGIKMWLLAQGPTVEVLSPQHFREEMKRAIEDMYRLYQH